MEKYYSSSFYNSYLTCGVVKDNTIFENFALKEYSNAMANLKITATCECRPVIIYIKRKDEEIVEMALKGCKNDYEITILTQHFFRCVYMLNILNAFNLDSAKGYTKKQLEQYIYNFQNGNLNQLKEDYRHAPCAYDINRLLTSLPKMELNIFCENTQNKYLQRSINDFIFARLPYAIKVFTNTQRLSQYITSNGDLLQAPHDFMYVNTIRFVSNEK